jgi:hypothetical protein
MKKGSRFQRRLQDSVDSVVSLYMTGSCGWSLKIRWDHQARAPLMLNAARGLLLLETKLPSTRFMQTLRIGQTGWFGKDLTIRSADKLTPDSPNSKRHGPGGRQKVQSKANLNSEQVSEAQRLKSNNCRG